MWRIFLRAITWCIRHQISGFQMHNGEDLGLIIGNIMIANVIHEKIVSCACLKLDT